MKPVLLSLLALTFSASAFAGYAPCSDINLGVTASNCATDICLARFDKPIEKLTPRDKAQVRACAARGGAIYRRCYANARAANRCGR